MNPSSSEATAESVSEYGSLPKLVGGTLVREISKGLDPGELAELRRWSPDQLPSSPTFWRMLLWHIEPAGHIAPDGQGGAKAERQWAALLSAMAQLKDLYVRGRSLGDAMVAANVSEARLGKLLRAEDDALFDALRAVVQQLASAREPVDWLDLTFLVLSDSWPDDARQKVRIRIARRYYTAQSRSETKGESP
jgi:CRISPR system Cascade subunit CasB